jgi:hypothetical protein
MKLFEKVEKLEDKEKECESMRDDIIGEITKGLEKETGLEFHCVESDEGKYFYFESYFPNSYLSICLVKINLFFLDVIYISCDDLELKEKVEKFFENA